MSFEQVRVYQLHQIEMPRIARRFEVQFECDRLYDFVWRYARIGDVGGLNVLRQPRLQHIAQHGFAAADFAGHLDDALALADRIDQRFEYGPAVSAAEKEIGVGGDAEWRLCQSEMGVVHVLAPIRGIGCYGHAAIGLNQAHRQTCCSFASGCRAWCDVCPGVWLLARDCPE